MISKDEIYQLLGEIAVKFSCLEHLCTDMLELLIDREDFVVGPMILDNMFLSKKTDLMGKYIIYRFQDNEPIKLEGIDLKKDIDKYRDLRNLFIHGFWILDENYRNKNIVSVLNYKLKYNKNKDLWERLKTKTFTTTKLKEYCRKIDNLIERTNLFIEKLKTIDMRSSKYEDAEKELAQTIEELKNKNNQSQIPIEKDGF